jgi:methanogenic corrinoid protein MtbC1
MADMNKLKQAMGDLEEELVLEIAKEIAGNGGSEAGAAMEACQEGMKTVGDRFEAGEYYVGDLIFAGEIMIGALRS